MPGQCAPMTVRLLDLLGEDRRIGFLERLLPALLRVELDHLGGTFLRRLEFLFLPVGHVVVAVFEELRHRTPVRRLVLGKHLEPGVRHELELEHEAVVGHVARHQDGVHALRAVPFKRLDEDLLRGLVAHVDVAQHAHLHARRAAHRAGRRREHAPRTCRRHRHRTYEKPLTGNVHICSFLWLQ